jgi:hypothetical protein
MARHLTDEDLEYLDIWFEQRILQELRSLREAILSALDDAITRLDESSNRVLAKLTELEGATNTDPQTAAVNTVSDKLDAAVPPPPPPA